MEDENSLELSLGLACGGSSGKTKAGTSDQNGADGSKGKAMTTNLNVSEGSFDKFFPKRTEAQDQAGQSKPESFWMNLGKSGSNTDAPVREFWASENKLTDDAAEEMSRLSKRKMPFEDTSLEKKPEIGSEQVESHRSSTEKEDLAESEAEGRSPWLNSQHVGNGKVSEMPKVNEKHFLGNTGLPCLQVSTPSEVSNVASAHNMTKFPLAMQLLPSSLGNNFTIHSPNFSSLQLAFGYPSGQLPVLERSSSLILGRSQDRKATSDGADCGDELKIAHAQASNNSVSASPLDLTKESEKHNEDGAKHLTSQIEVENDRNKSIFRQNEAPKQLVIEEGARIRPGVDPDLKFGGSGSCPDLPWVSTTGSGPNGKTISGVTYKYSQNQIKIVCACHGSHLSPEEFIQHANADDTDAEDNTGVGSFPSGNVASPAHT